MAASANRRFSAVIGKQGPNPYVADASIMPTVTHANTNVSCIMIGERVSDFIREAGR